MAMASTKRTSKGTSHKRRQAEDSGGPVNCRVLNLAEPTVKNHITAILKALNVTNRTEAVIRGCKGVALIGVIYLYCRWLFLCSCGDERESAEESGVTEHVPV